MIIKNKSYPHPVLSPHRDDISNSPLFCDINAKWDKSYYYFQYEFSLDNETILDLILNQKAHLIIHIECGRTFYRHAHSVPPSAFNGNAAKGTITLPADCLKDRTEVSVFVCASSPITNYQPAGMHPDYENMFFTLQKGDVLAYWQTFTFDLRQDYDPLKKIDSIICFQIDESRETGEMTVIFDADKLTALLPRDIYELYADLCSDKSKEDLFVATLALPVLMEGLLYLKDKKSSDGTSDLDHWRTKKWFRSLEKKLSDMQINITTEQSMLEIAQKIFENPFKKAGLSVKHFNEI